MKAKRRENKQNKKFQFEKRSKVFSEKQSQAIEEDWSLSKIQEICYDGGARCGKTYLVIKAIISRAWISKESRHLIARYRLNHLKMSVWRQTVLPCLKDMGFVRGRDFEINESDLIVTFSNGSEIYGAGLDDSDRVEKIMGTEYNTIFVNEATQISYATFQKIKTRLSYVREDLTNKLIVDCNPRNRFHWIFKYFVLRQDPETGKALPLHRIARMSRRHWTPLDNPYISDEYKQMLDELTGIERDRLYKGQWVDVQGLVYPKFESAIVEPFSIPEVWDCAGAVDFGYTNPFVFLWFFLDKSNETWYLADEYYLPEKTVRAHCEFLKTKRKPNLFLTADHDAEDRATLAENGFLTIAADKDVTTGIQAVIRLIEAEQGIKLRIFRSCVHTIEEFSVYSWEEPKDNKNAKEVPIKNYDHAMDALRYFALRVVTKKHQVVTTSLEKIKREIEQRPKGLETLRRERLTRFGINSDRYKN
ncbi:PBSX family phage terminase large subunit [Leptospira interrogans]|uniref:PBSX family phage terminase large subunit n=2 Tax=Leptospira interrogans TaxID=173 RepID=A0AAP9WNT7_LEPIR|nr:PBSX family phage terminase large subunit [Leptospira interrogans]MCR8638982.1 terminase [Leptospira interrogans serovar Ricardi]QOI53143.1 PBSX family phage terminase large subunit [Leptospira interrogans serovar Bataviae]